MKLHKFFALAPLALLLAGCSEAPKPVEKAKEPAKPAEPVTALSAVYKMYTQARAWSPDAKILRVGSLTLKEVKAEAGKAGAWEATFVSEPNKRARRYTFSVVESPSSNLHEGVFGGAMDSYTPGRQQTPFMIQAFRTDSTDAYTTAMADPKVKAYAAKNPQMPVLLLLEQTPRFPDPAWRLVFGESVATSNFSAFVDAATGKFLQTSR